MTEWNNELTLEFIKCYEKYPVLWNRKCPGHKNRNTLNDAWLNISKELSIEIPIIELKKKKESLMSTYRTLRKKVTVSYTTGTGSQDVYPSWFAYNAIDRVTKEKIATLNSEYESDESATETLPFTQNMDEDYAEPKLEEHEVSISQTSESTATDNNTKQDETISFAMPQPVAPKKRRTNNQNIDAQVTQHLKAASNALHNLTNKAQIQSTPLPQDAVALYGQLLVEKLRKFPDRTRLILQHQIDNMVFEAELKKYDSTPMIYNANKYSRGAGLYRSSSSESNNSSGSPYSLLQNFSSSCTRQPSPNPSDMSLHSPAPSNTSQHSPNLSHKQQLSINISNNSQQSSTIPHTPQNVIDNHEPSEIMEYFTITNELVSDENQLN